MLFSLGFSRENRRSSHEAPVASPGGDQLVMCQASIITTINPNENVPLPHSCHPDAAPLLTKLHGVAKRLPSESEVPRDMNELADFIGHPTHLVGLDTPTNDVWELADPILN